MSDATPPPPTESHATASRPWHQRRAAQRLITLGLILTVVAAAAWIGRPTWRQLWLLHVQRQCLDFALPPDRVAYEVESADPPVYAEPYPASSASRGWLDDLLARPGYRRAGGPFRVDATAAYFAAEHIYAPLARFPTVPVRTPEVEAHWPAGPCLFLHSRRAPGGEERLVVVDLLMTEHTTDPTATFAIGGSVIVPATFKTNPREHRHVARPLTLHFDHRFHLRIFAGQPDAADASHFTIAYEASAVDEPAVKAAGVIDGWLREMEGVELRPRDGAFDGEGRWLPLPFRPTGPASRPASQAP